MNIYIATAGSKTEPPLLLRLRRLFPRFFLRLPPVVGVVGGVGSTRAAFNRAASCFCAAACAAAACDAAAGAAGAGAGAGGGGGPATPGAAVCCCGN